MSIRNYLTKQKSFESEQSQMLLTIDKSKQEQMTRKEPKLYTVTDEYLLNVIKVQRQSQEQMQELKKEMIGMKKRLVRCEQKLCRKSSRKDREQSSQKHGRNKIWSSSYRFAGEKGHHKSKNVYYSPEILFDTSSPKTQNRYGSSTVLTFHRKSKHHADNTEKKDKNKDSKELQKSLSRYLVIQDYGGSKRPDKKTHFTFGSEFRRNTEQKKDLTAKKCNNSHSITANSTQRQIKKLKNDFDLIASEEMREKNIGEKKNKRKQMVKISQMIDQLEKTDKESKKLKRHQSPQIYVNRQLQW